MHTPSGLADSAINHIPKMHFQRQALTSTKMKSRRDCLGQQEFLCCNHSLSMQKPTSHKWKEEEEKGRCSREKQQLTLLEFMRKETLGRERTGKDQTGNELQGPFSIMALPEQSGPQNQADMYSESKIIDLINVCPSVGLRRCYGFLFFTLCFCCATTHQWVNMFLACESHINPQCLVAFPIKNSVGVIKMPFTFVISA